MGKTSKIFIFKTTQMKWKKCVFETAEKEDVTLDAHVGYVGRSNNIIAVD